MNRLAIFAGYDKDGIIDDYVIYYIKELKKIADIIYVSDCDIIESELEKISPYCIHMINGRHREYDFGSYKRGYLYARDNNLLNNYHYLIFCNDSMYGPFFEFEPIFEEMEGLRFKIGPKSFYQTNSEQAYNLYKVARDFAGLTGTELVYDLYTGTGTIANFVSRNANKVIGIEYVPEAIEDAKVNSEINKIDNTLFFAGDMKDILTQDFINQHGRPDVIITDPPRAGMHTDVIDTILFAEPKRIVYVSCNPATQARDLQLLDSKYKVKAVQPVDMFPHTHHVENVVLLEKR